MSELATQQPVSSEQEWREVLARVEAKVSRHVFLNWFKPIQVVSRGEADLILGVRDFHARERLIEDFTPVLGEAVAEVTGSNLRIKVIADGQYDVPIPSPEEQEEDPSTTEALSNAARDAIVQETQDAHDRGFASRLLIQATLPHSKPKAGEFFFERTNGYVTIQIAANRRFGLPYGTYPRLTLALITTEAVRTKSPIIELGSMRRYMDRLEVGYSSGKQGSARRAREHLQRLITSTVSADCRREGEWRNVGFRPVDKVEMFWAPADEGDDETGAWSSTLQLNQTFFEEITRKPVPVCMNALRLLSKGRSPLALDIYEWLTYRFSYLREPSCIPWQALQAQFGCDYKLVRQFKAKFVQQLKVVKQVYKDANVEVTTRGLLLRPSKPHIPMRLIQGGRK